MDGHKKLQRNLWITLISNCWVLPPNLMCTFFMSHLCLAFYICLSSYCGVPFPGTQDQVQTHSKLVWYFTYTAWTLRCKYCGWGADAVHFQSMYFTALGMPCSGEVYNSSAINTSNQILAPLYQGSGTVLAFCLLTQQVHSKSTFRGRSPAGL